MTVQAQRGFRGLQHTGFDADAFSQKPALPQRAGWAGMTMLVTTAVAGLIVPLAVAGHEAESGRLHAKFDRVVRAGSTAQLELKVLQPGESVDLAVSREWVEAMELQQLTPKPVAVHTSAKEVHYRFSAKAGPEPLVVRMKLEPHRVGSARAAIRLDGAPLELSQLVLP